MVVESENAVLDVLGVPISAINIPLALGMLRGWIADRSKHYICVRDVHGVIRCQDDPALMRIHRAASMVTPDGMPLVWLLRRHGFGDADRVYGPEFLESAARSAVLAGARHYFYGGRGGRTRLMAERFARDFPDFNLVGYREPGMLDVGQLDAHDTIEEINAAKPDILWVGLGTPKQEYWMFNHRPLIEAPVIIGVGAAFDFFSGGVKQAPRWVQRSGMEWAFRVAADPRRLAGRYARTVPRFISLIAADYLKRGLRLHPYNG